jgi:periplasmic protein CpxP/Spy
MCKKLFWIIAFTSLLFTQIAFADSSVCRETLSKMVQSLNLNETQKAKVKPVLEQLKTSMQGIKSQMSGLEDQITQQVNSDNMDQDKVNGIVDQKTKLIGDAMKARITAKRQIFSILNPQQKGKLQGMLKKADEKMAALFKSCEKD